MNYIKEKRNKEDYCNICGKLAVLTWDHVPPKSITAGSPVNANSLFEGLPSYGSYQKEYQNGVKYRSICAECNNVRLGSLDRIYIDFVNKIRDYIEIGRSPTIDYRVPIQVNKLCRAIVGHFLAAKNFYDMNCMVDKMLREYLLNENLLPKFNLFYWIYPYDTVFNIRDIVVSGYHENDSSLPHGMISVMASYPIAFMITEQNEEIKGLQDLTEMTTTNIDEYVEVPVQTVSAFAPGTNNLRHYVWPCNVGDEIAFVLVGKAGGEDSRIAIPKIKYR